MVPLDKKLQHKKDAKFITDIGIMAMFNVMLMFWNPLIEIPATVLLVVLSFMQKASIKQYELKINEISE